MSSCSNTIDLATGSPVINGVSRTLYMCDDSLVHLQAFTGLETLSVPPWMTNAGLVHIATLQNLKGLYLSNSKVNDQGLTYLDPGTNLEILLLQRGNFTDACIPTILQFSGLKTISVEFTQISANGRQQLRDAFPNATIIPSGN